MSNWVPAGSVAYDTAYAEGDQAFHDDGSVPYFSTVEYLPPKVGRGPDSKHCIANDNTCKGFKCKGTDFCSGHLMSQAKAD